MRQFHTPFSQEKQTSLLLLGEYLIFLSEVYRPYSLSGPVLLYRSFAVPKTGNRSVERRKPDCSACLFRVAVRLHLHDLPTLSRVDLCNQAFFLLPFALMHDSII